MLDLFVYFDAKNCFGFFLFTLVSGGQLTRRRSAQELRQCEVELHQLHRRVRLLQRRQGLQQNVVHTNNKAFLLLCSTVVVVELALLVEVHTTVLLLWLYTGSDWLQPTQCSWGLSWLGLCSARCVSKTGGGKGSASPQDLEEKMKKYRGQEKVRACVCLRPRRAPPKAASRLHSSPSRTALHNRLSSRQMAKGAATPHQIYDWIWKKIRL